MMENKEFKITNDIMALQSDRFINYIIDLIIQYALIFLFGITLGILAELSDNTIFVDWLSNLSSGEEYFFGVFISLFYYFISEVYFSRTIGKMITKTVVVMEDGSKPDPLTILKRTFCRIIPFDGLSFLGSGSRGWHDTIPNVYVVKKRVLEESRELFYAFEEIGETAL